MKNKLIVVFVAIGIIAIGFLIFKVFSGMKEKPKPEITLKAEKYVHTDVVHYKNNQSKIIAFGQLKPVNSIDVFSEVNGIVLKQSNEFKVGNYFHSGDNLLEIDDREARLSLYAQKSDFLNVLTSILPDIKADYSNSFDKWNGYLENFEIEKSLNSLPKITDSKEKYFLAARNVFKLYYSIKNLELRLSKYEIKAPFDGVVTQSMIHSGTLIRAGQKLGAFSGINQFEIELPLSEKDVFFVNIGNKVELISDNLNQSIPGRISRISRSIDPSTQTIDVYANVSGSNLKDGMYFKAIINGNIIPNSFIVPRKAIVNNEAIYYVDNGKLARKKIDILLFGDNSVYIKGIDSLTEIVTEPLVNFVLGENLKIIK